VIKNLKNKKIYVFLLVFFLLLGFLGARRYIARQRATKTAEYYFKKASQDIGPGSGAADVKKWLTDNSFAILKWNPTQEEGWIGTQKNFSETGTSECFVVQGSKNIYDGFLIDMIFEFDKEYNFQSIYYHLRKVQ